ncbi:MULTISPECIES: cyclase family protein [unclassified Bacillus (in: firmicutes)]|uniref:cyclase family protein n=1 Tax=unclassified Bacillus (in: firmicutes) TaxID=185979 RepID=UPI002889ECE3|nr:MULTISPECIES: cyclase family protein [unclassified Bacillus (in: firmicutes)]
MSTHLGTHIDAPYHFDENGKKIIELDLDLYIGTASVVKVDEAESIGIKAFEGIELTGVRRLLVATGQWKDLSRFPEWIPPVEPDLAPFLANKGVRLLGLDLPSVDCLDSKELPAHNKLSGCGIHILEGLVLDGLLAWAVRFGCIAAGIGSRGREPGQGRGEKERLRRGIIGWVKLGFTDLPSIR